MFPLSDPRVRSVTLAISLWLFGIFTTLLLVGVWGRAVTADRPTLTDSTEMILESELVNDRVEAWLMDGLAASSPLPPTEAKRVVASVTDSSEMDTAIALLADEAVTSALSPPGTAPSIDLQPAATALVPAVSRALAGIDIAPEVVQSVMSNADLELSSATGSWASGAAHRSTGALTWVLVAGLVGMVTAGAISVSLSDDRLSRIRSLAWRVTVSSISFALMLRLGAWAVDPSGGRSPVAGATAAIIGSNGHVPLLVATAALGVALLARWRRHPSLAGGDPEVSLPATRT